ncbi:hypothetical protein OKW96_10900 [Sphingobacterium sp. KU25419]|nr:hypothetical protein OKW96_10900 [Sphingobacterium sp. KU25419]
MLGDIQFCKDAGCDGVVIGILNVDGTVDVERTNALIEAARPMQVPFIVLLINALIQSLH